MFTLDISFLVSPLEDSLDEGNPPIALSSAPLLIDPTLTGSLHAQGTKLGDGLVHIQLPERPNHDLDLVDFARGGPVVVAIVTLGVFKVSQRQFSWRDAFRGNSLGLMRCGCYSRSNAANAARDSELSKAPGSMRNWRLPD
jgi:hypothetical protein